mmetsp:Transcript_24879/g.33988  ORF Transcript_24879/g.33988 Transcript_24879/m.33988 type:complete len:172 (+) Transcript_24879:3-518(+)
MRVTRCCCCVPIKVGAYIIGSIHVIGLILGVILVSPLQISLEIFCGATFLYMAYRDNEKNRLLYFAAYAVYCFILGFIRMVFVFWDKDEKALVQQYCKTLQDQIDMAREGKPGWEATDFANVQDCRSQVGTAVARDELVSLLLTLFLQIHFCLVLWAHYTNSHMVKSKGGC